MAADGSKPKQRVSIESLAYPEHLDPDPVIRNYQMIALGIGERAAPTEVDRIYLRFSWNDEAEARVEEVLKLPAGARHEHCLHISGGARVGKTAIARALLRKYPPSRTRQGLRIPLGYMVMPSIPDQCAIAQTMLWWLGDPTWNHRRAKTERFFHVVDVLDELGVEAMLVDDFQHLVDTRGLKVQHAAADFFKEIAFYAKRPFIYLGLARMAKVFEANEQLGGRKEAPIRVRHLDWSIETDRALFVETTGKVMEALSSRIVGIDWSDLATNFRWYCSTGGRMGYVVRVLRSALSAGNGKGKVDLQGLRRAVLNVTGKPSAWPNGHDPFHNKFPAIASPETLRIAARIGEEDLLGPNHLSGAKK